jgi:hypothetical protein
MVRESGGRCVDDKRRFSDVHDYDDVPGDDTGCFIVGMYIVYADLKRVEVAVESNRS